MLVSHYFLHFNRKLLIMWLLCQHFCKSF